MLHQIFSKDLLLYTFFFPRNRAKDSNPNRTFFAEFRHIFKDDEAYQRDKTLNGADLKMATRATRDLTNMTAYKNCNKGRRNFRGKSKGNQSPRAVPMTTSVVIMPKLRSSHLHGVHITTSARRIKQPSALTVLTTTSVEHAGVSAEKSEDNTMVSLGLIKR